MQRSYLLQVYFWNIVRYVQDILASSVWGWFWKVWILFSRRRKDWVSYGPRGPPCNNLPSLVGKTREQRRDCYGATTKGRKERSRFRSMYSFLANESHQISRIMWESLRSEFDHAPWILLLNCLGFSPHAFCVIELVASGKMTLAHIFLKIWLEQVE